MSIVPLSVHSFITVYPRQSDSGLDLLKTKWQFVICNAQAYSQHAQESRHLPKSVLRKFQGGKDFWRPKLNS